MWARNNIVSCLERCTSVHYCRMNNVGLMPFPEIFENLFSRTEPSNLVLFQTVRKVSSLRKGAQRARCMSVCRWIFLETMARGDGGSAPTLSREGMIHFLSSARDHLKGLLP